MGPKVVWETYCNEKEFEGWEHGDKFQKILRELRENVSGPVVRPTDETHTRCDTNGYLRITHDRGRCNGIEMISRDSLNKSSLFRHFILYVV